MSDSRFQITYLFHSGFLVEDSRCYYLFDYYRGTLPPLNPKKPLLVFASHSHPDHYNPKIFELLALQKMTQVTAIVPRELFQKMQKKGAVKKRPPENVTVLAADFHKHYELPCGICLEALQSTDIGAAFFVKCPDGMLYHGGDLHDWVREEQSEQYNRQMTGSYRHEIDLLASLCGSMPIDAAFLPLDPLLQEYYARGILYFLEKVPVKQVYPMHYWSEPAIIQKFLREYPKYQGIVQYTERLDSAT